MMTAELRARMGEAAVRAAQAGHDVLLVVHDLDAQRRAHDAFVKAWRGGAAWERTVARIERLLEPGAAPKPESGEEAALKIARLAVRVERDPMGVLPLSPKGAIVVPAYHALTDRYAFEEELGNPAEFVRGRVRQEVIEVPVEPEEDAIVELSHALNGRDVALFCFDALRYERQRKLLLALQAACPRFVCVPVRNPWDAQICRWETTILHPWGFRAANLVAACERL